MVKFPRVVAIMMERNVKQQMGSLSETFVGLITESQTTNHNPSELTGSDVREVSH